MAYEARMNCRCHLENSAPSRNSYLTPQPVNHNQPSPVQLDKVFNFFKSANNAPSKEPGVADDQLPFNTVKMGDLFDENVDSRGNVEGYAHQSNYLYYHDNEVEQKKNDTPPRTQISFKHNSFGKEKHLLTPRKAN